MTKLQKVLLYTFTACAILTVPWFLFMNHYLQSSFVKVDAKVVKYVYDYKSEWVPLLEYKTVNGRTYQDEGSFGYKANNNIHLVPMPAVGSTVTAYYDKAHPDSITYLRDPFYLVIFFLPIAIFFIGLLACLIITLFIFKFAKSDSSTVYIKK